MTIPDARSLVGLVRLPAVLTVPGDALVGAAWSAGGAGSAVRPGVAGLGASGSLIYLGGMALNDYADRDIDARERSDRPIPSGRVSPGFALGLAAVLSAAGVSMAALSAGRAGARAALALTATAWGYDLALKGTPAGPAAMATARGLDVALGAVGASRRAALPAVAAVGAHTYAVTLVSRVEVEGSSPARAGVMLACSTLVAGVAGVAAAGSASRSRRQLAIAGGCSALYVGAVAAAAIPALREPSPARMQRLVGAGVTGLPLLQGALLAARGATGAALAMFSTWRVAGALHRRAPVT